MMPRDHVRWCILTRNCKWLLFRSCLEPLIYSLPWRATKVVLLQMHHYWLIKPFINIPFPTSYQSSHFTHVIAISAGGQPLFDTSMTSFSFTVLGVLFRKSGHWMNPNVPSCLFALPRLLWKGTVSGFRFEVKMSPLVVKICSATLNARETIMEHRTLRRRDENGRRTVKTLTAHFQNMKNAQPTAQSIES